ncbi:MAG: hypothetical protein ACPGVG_20705, partial [Mycobacterium sp.]
QDIIDTAIVVLKDFGLYDGCTICGHIGYDEDDLSDIGEALLAALRERYAVVERPEPREVTVLKNAWWLDGDVTAVVGSGRVRCELEDHRLSSDEARALAAALLAAAAEADQ